jgi:hypothetical protein
MLFALLLMTSTPIKAEHINLPKNSGGWTIFTSLSDSRICYIAADGNDATARYYSPNDAAIGQNPRIDIIEIRTTLQMLLTTGSKLAL